MRHLDELISEVEEWATRNFPDGSLEGIASHLAKEHVELQYAVSEYLGPWSDLDGPFSPARAAQIGDVRRNDLFDEIADNVILLMRMTSALGGDFLEVVNNKWDIVRERDYIAHPGRGRPESNDHRPIIDRSSTDDPWIVVTTIFYDGETPTYLARERESRVYHLTANLRSAFRFENQTEAEGVLGSLSWLGTGDGPPLKAVRLGDLPVQSFVEADEGDWVDIPSSEELERQRLVNIRVEKLEQELRNIVAADWRTWEELATPEQFVRWAKARAFYALAEVPE